MDKTKAIKFNPEIRNSICLFIDFRLKSRKVIIKFKNINNEIITSIAFKDRIGISRDISDVRCFKIYDNITQVIMIANVKKNLFIFRILYQYAPTIETVVFTVAEKIRASTK